MFSYAMVSVGLCLGMLSCATTKDHGDAGNAIAQKEIKGNHDLVGIWKMETLGMKGTKGQPCENDVYKIIGDDYFVHIEMPKYETFDEGIRYYMKAGNCKRASDSLLIEGTEQVSTYLVGNDMCLEWWSANGCIQEIWKKAKPNKYLVGAIEAMLPKKTMVDHEFNGTWHLLRDSIVTADMYRVVSGDTYSWYIREAYRNEVITWSCMYGTFKRLATTVTVENGDVYMPILWMSDDKSMMRNYYDPDQDGKHFLFQNWYRADLPETLLRTKQFLNQHFGIKE